LAFAKVLPQFRSLRELSFAHNSVGATGLLALASALEKSELTPTEKAAQADAKAMGRQANANASVNGVSSLKRVILGENKILAPEIPWVLNLRASRMIENGYMW
jgi:hypothetical protein